MKEKSWYLEQVYLFAYAYADLKGIERANLTSIRTTEGEPLIGQEDAIVIPYTFELTYQVRVPFTNSKQAEAHAKRNGLVPEVVLDAATGRSHFIWPQAQMVEHTLTVHSHQIDSGETDKLLEALRRQKGE